MRRLTFNLEAKPVLCDTLTRGCKPTKAIAIASPCGVKGEVESEAWAPIPDNRTDVPMRLVTVAVSGISRERAFPRFLASYQCVSRREVE